MESLQEQLESIFYRDQEPRLIIQDLHPIKDKEEYNRLWKQIRIDDKNNQDFIDKHFENRGWLGEDEIGYEASTAQFLVLQHGPLEFQLKWKSLFKQAVIQGKARKDYFALFIDRILLRQGEKQIFGTQWIKRKNYTELLNSIYLEEINQNRKKIGLEPLKKTKI